MAERTIALVGGGLIGSSWAVVFARAGHTVRVYEAVPEQRTALQDRVRRLLLDLEAEGLVENAAAAAERVVLTESLKDAVQGAGHVQENGPERLEVKQPLLSEIDAAAPAEATIASSTSALLPSALSDHLTGRRRFLVAHPVNPPHLIPLVELCPAPWTDAAAVERVRALMAEVGQSPILVRREIDGFILNRLQGALLHEAFRLVEQGYARVEDVDAAVADGLGLRWSFMGPFETIDLNAPQGLADYGRRYGGMYAGMFGVEPWSGELLAKAEEQRRAMLPREALVERQSWRDRRLLRLVQHKKAMDKSDKEK